MENAVDEFTRLFKVSGENRVWVQTEEADPITGPDPKLYHVHTELIIAMAMNERAAEGQDCGMMWLQNLPGWRSE